jgi:hypothetical protein
MLCPQLAFFPNWLSLAFPVPNWFGGAPNWLPIWFVWTGGRVDVSEIQQGGKGRTLGKKRIDGSVCRIKRMV